ncbi:hypothetical protein BN59_01889 [Legionella massiliensis]|uniref:Uncharacterized protein n=1 Tax=Legionella massiliensis TaxID=1034943 RepID=A0A078KT28_9GAMM|nr:hypothetical protein [Legionella massiliensis]CDZ77605.1 hypothetical protein BN59_01889 [Legionella massiliensis]CEE13343.1 hypothetical protein BN1094_01889 [Legionella massiliensis]
MIELLTELSHNIAYAIWALATGVGRAGVTSSYFIRDTFRAHYNLLGQHTAPIEQELLDTRPPTPSSLNIFGQIALSPLVILAWLASVTLIPLLYNSVLLSISGFLKTANFALLDLPADKQIKQLNGSMPWYRLIFGIPGFVLGGAVGLIAAGAIGLVRVVTNSLKSAIHSFASVTNLALEEEDEIELFGLDKDQRSAIRIYGFGLPGVILGGIAGSFGFAIASLGRVIVNSYKTAKSLTVSGVNVARREGEQFEADLKHDGRSNLLKFGLGFPGLLFGSVTAALGLGLSSLYRSVVESWKTTKRVFVSVVNQALPANEEGEAPSQLELEAEERLFVDQHIFGAPGYLIGALTGGLGFATVIFGRVIKESFESGTHSFATVINYALDSEDSFQEIGMNRDERPTHIKFGFGLPGTIIGGLIGTVGYTAVGLGRILTNSYTTAKGLTISAVNVVRHDDETLQGDFQHDIRPNFRKYLLGLPGLIIGSATALIGLGFATVQRSAVESWKTSLHLFTKIVRQASLEQEEPSEIASDEAPQRSTVDYYLFGAPGLLFGTFAGSLGFLAISAKNIVAQSISSAAHSFATVTNLALANEDRIEHYGFDQDERANRLKYGFGLPGTIFGGLAGSIAFLAVGIGRVITNSYATAKGLTISGINSVRAPDDLELRGGLQQDRRSSILKYVLGFPGLIIGSVSASIAIAITGLGRLNKESVKTGKEVFTSFIQRALPAAEEGEEQALLQNREERSFMSRYVYGAPGLLIGAITGAVGFAAIIGVRSAIQSVKSAMNSFATVTNLALDPEDRIQGLSFEQDRRPNSEKYGLGFPGLFLGGLAGSLGFALVGIGRVFTNSYKTAKSLTLSAVNAVRHDNEQIPEGLEQDGRSTVLKFVLGFPGLIIGSVTAALGLGFASLQRIVVESLKTANKVHSSIVKQALPAGEAEAETFPQPELANEQRLFVDRHIFGAPGYLFGAFTGSLGFAAVIVGRVFSESVTSAIHSFSTVINPSLAEELRIQRFGMAIDGRPAHIKFGFGLPGVILGGFAGALGFVGVYLGRIAANSYATVKSLTVSGINVARHDNEQLGEDLQHDTRSNLQKYVFGFPGLIIGSMTAAVGLVLSGLQRSFIESWKTTSETYSAIVRQVEPQRDILESEQVEPLVEQRSFVDRYIFGLPGVLAGAISGGAVFVGRGIHRIFKESFNTGTRTFASVANVGLNDDERFPYQELGQQDERSWQAKYLLGLPGVVIGGLFGTVTLAGIGAVKGASHSFYSWRSLSGSLLNGSLETPFFGGLAADKRSDNAKLAGLPGYALAMATTLPVSFVVLIFKKVIPVTLGLILGVISSPIVAALKGINQALKKPRFEAQEPVEDAEQRFQNIYSSLKAGRLPANETISEGQNGRKGPWAFTRKAFTFNISTITEYTLDKVLAGYRASENKDAFFENGEFTGILDEVKEYYKTLSCLEPQYHSSDRDRQIDEIGAFVKDYVLHRDRKVPEFLYSHPKRSWTATFWGVDPTASDARQDQEEFILERSVELS